MSRIIALVLAFAAFGLTACGDGGGGGGAPPPAPPASEWLITYSPTMPPALQPDGQGGFYFDFPPQDGVHMVYKNVTPGTVQVGQTVSMTFAITGTGDFIPSDSSDVKPTKVRLFLQQQGDAMTAAEEFKRWWATETVELRPGEFTLSMPIQPDKWTSVFGKAGTVNPDAFNQAIQQLEHVGFTFGGAYFSAHGVYVTQGQARYTLKSYTVQ